MAEVSEVKTTKVYKKGELRAMYGVHQNTFTNWLKRIEPELIKVGYTRRQHYLYPIHLSVIYRMIGEP